MGLKMSEMIMFGTVTALVILLVFTAKKTEQFEDKPYGPRQTVTVEEIVEELDDEYFELEESNNKIY